MTHQQNGDASTYERQGSNYWWGNGDYNAQGQGWHAPAGPSGRFEYSHQPRYESARPNQSVGRLAQRENGRDPHIPATSSTMERKRQGSAKNDGDDATKSMQPAGNLFNAIDAFFNALDDYNVKIQVQREAEEKAEKVKRFADRELKPGNSEQVKLALAKAEEAKKQSGEAKRKVLECLEIVLEINKDGAITNVSRQMRIEVADLHNRMKQGNDNLAKRIAEDGRTTRQDASAAQQRLESKVRDLERRCAALAEEVENLRGKADGAERTRALTAAGESTARGSASNPQVIDSPMNIAHEYGAEAGSSTSANDGAKSSAQTPKQGRLFGSKLRDLDAKLEELRSENEERDSQWAIELDDRVNVAIETRIESHRRKKRLRREAARQGDAAAEQAAAEPNPDAQNLAQSSAVSDVRQSSAGASDTHNDVSEVAPTALETRSPAPQANNNHSRNSVQATTSVVAAATNGSASGSLSPGTIFGPPSANVAPSDALRIIADHVSRNIRADLQREFEERQRAFQSQLIEEVNSNMAQLATQQLQVLEVGKALQDVIKDIKKLRQDAESVSDVLKNHFDNLQRHEGIINSLINARLRASAAATQNLASQTQTQGTPVAQQNSQRFQSMQQNGESRS